MNSCDNMVTYDQWSYMTIFSILEVVLMGINEEGIQIDCLLLVNAT